LFRAYEIDERRPIVFSQTEIQQIYEKRAPLYNITANLYYLIGFREMHYRRMAVERLDPRPGQTVVELCCGTGINFDLLQRRVGPTGRIIGVDMTRGMLDQARRRVQKRGWKNVELIERDVADFEIPRGVDRVISTFALSLSPHYAEVIARVQQALPLGGRFALLDLKAPDNAGPLMVRIAAMTARPFAVTPDLVERRAWETVEREFDEFSCEQLFFGFAYLAMGRVANDGGGAS